jgi:hypothetical protein
MGTSPLQFSEGSDVYCTTSTSRYAQVRTVSILNLDVGVHVIL